MKPVIAFANHKGGVGKTTSAVNIASVLGEMGKRVLVIDIDPQGSASLHFGVRDKGMGFLHAMERTVAAPVLPTAVRGVDLIPSGPALSEAAQRFSGVLGAELLARLPCADSRRLGTGPNRLPAWSRDSHHERSQGEPACSHSN